MKRLVCVSNRISLPRRTNPPGGLAVGVLAALQSTGGLWFGWSGETSEEHQAEPEILVRGNVRFATIDLTATDLNAYYNGYCNSTLWPLFHYFPDRFTHDQDQHDTYHAVNALFARQLVKLLEPGDVIWVHDYQLIPLGRYLRREGFEGAIGFFLHIPFPHVQVLRVLPGYGELVRDLCQYDLVGFQTDDDLRSFLSCIDPAQTQLPLERGYVEMSGRAVRLGVYPIGVDVDQITIEVDSAATQESVRRLSRSLQGRKLIVGCDRLDYSKGLPERFAAFEHFLESFPENRGKVTYLQIAPLSRGEVGAYSEIRQALEQAAGRTNGRLAEAEWTPIRYLNRNYSHGALMGFLRAADVALVTPVRDGMNLVAKEFVAAQDPDDPGVLILSPLAGASDELPLALQMNPYDKRGMALAIQTALNMPLTERRQRYEQLLAAVREHDIHAWYGRFLQDLTGESPHGPWSLRHGQGLPEPASALFTGH
jgi:trehalose 6-phosphate synthase